MREARLAIHPAGETPPPIKIIGFNVREEPQ